MLRKALFILAIALSVQLPVAQRLASLHLDDDRPLTLQVNSPLPRLEIDKAALEKVTKAHAAKAQNHAKLQADPEANNPKHAPKRADDATQWGEWREYVQGTLTTTNKWPYEQLYGEGSFPERVTLMRRDAVGNPDLAQLKFPGFFGDTDFILDYDVPNKTVSWGNIDLGKKFPGYESDEYINATWASRSGRRFSLKENMNLESYFLVTNTGGFQMYITFVPDTKPEAGLDIEFDIANVNDEYATLTFPKVTGAVDKIKYVIRNTDRIDYQDEIIYDMIEKDRPELDIRTVSAQEAASYSQRFDFSATGPYAVLAVALDADGDRILSKGVCKYASLREPSKWRDAGTGTFTDAFLSNVITNYKWMEGTESYKVTFPEWEDVKTWEVKIEESIETPGLYRVVNPYGEACPYFNATFGWELKNDPSSCDYFTVEFDRENDYYLLIHCENTARPWIEASYSGLSYGYNYDRNHLLSPYIWSINEGYNSTVHSYPDAFVPFIKYENRRIYSDYGFELTLPGYIDYTFSIEKTYNSAKIADLGSGAAKVKYTIMPAGQYTGEAGCALIRTSSPDANILEATNGEALNLEAFGVETGKRYDIFAVSYDEAGNPQTDRSLLRTAFHQYDYKFYGYVTFNEFLFSGSSYSVEVYTAVETPGVYYLHEPYSVYTGYYDASVDRYMAVDMSDTNRVKIPLFDSGLNLGSDQWVYIQSTGNYFENQGNTPDEIAAAGLYLYFNNYGEVVIPGRGLLYSFTNENNGDWYYANTSEETLFRFPGYPDYRFSLRAILNGAELYDIRPEVDHIEYTLADAATTMEDELLDKLSARSTDITIKNATGEGPLDLSAWDLTVGHAYFIVALSYDAFGVERESASVKIIADPDYSYVGQGEMTDGFIANMYALPDDAVWSVDVYTLEETPGVVYVKDPYSTEYPYFNYFTSDFSVPRWMAINISNPDRVFIEEYYTGLSESGSKISVLTFSEFFRANGKTDDEMAAAGYFGSYSDRTITVPSKAIAVRLGDQYYGAPETGTDFKLVLPENYSGVESVTVAEPEIATAEYFDLSGRRVHEPTTGIYIVKRGTRITKEVLRR